MIQLIILNKETNRIMHLSFYRSVVAAECFLDTLAFDSDAIFQIVELDIAAVRAALAVN